MSAMRPDMNAGPKLRNVSPVSVESEIGLFCVFAEKVMRTNRIGRRCLIME